MANALCERWCQALDACLWEHDLPNEGKQLQENQMKSLYRLLAQARTWIWALKAG